MLLSSFLRRRRSVILSSLAVSIIVHILLLFFFASPIAELQSLKRLVKPRTPRDVMPMATGEVLPELRKLSRRNKEERCTMCRAASQLCEEYGASKITRAVSYEGSNERLRRFLAKVKSGQPFTVGVIGGSVSQGSGIPWGNDDDAPREPAYRPQNMHRVIFEHLHAMSPLSKGDAVPFNSSVLHGSVGSPTGEHASFKVSGKKKGKNTLINGAQGGTGSGYFAYCWGEHVDRDTDLFIVELAINDEPLMKNLESYELMIRSLMDLPHKPAVISIEVFALMFASMAMGGELHKSINEFYDVPSISLRNSFLSYLMGDSTEVERFFRRDKGEPGDFDGIDLRHLSHLGHRLSGELVNAYIDMQLCEMRNQRPDLDESWPMDKNQIAEYFPVSDHPRMRLNTRYDRHAVQAPLRPQCFTMKTKESNRLAPIRQHGWRTWSHGEKHYWISTEVGATITFAFTTVIGSAQIHYLRSKTFGLGNVWCWVDNDKAEGERIQGWWHLEFNIDQSTSFDDLTPGDHLLHCEIDAQTNDPGGGHEFRITSLTSI